MANIEELVSAAFQNGAYTEEWARAIQDQALSLDPAASNDLSMFAVADRRFAGESVLVPVARGLDLGDEFLSAIDMAWRQIAGHSEAKRALSILAAAKIEFVRSQLHSLLWEAGMRREPEEGASEEMRDKLKDSARTREWNDADEACLAPLPVELTLDAPSTCFREWLASYDHETEIYEFAKRAPCNAIHPAPTPGELLGALALVWLDASATLPSHSIKFLSLAAMALQDAAYSSGWEDAERMRAEDASRAGKAAADKRHAPNYARRDKVIEIYQRGSFQSKDQAAEYIVTNKLVAASFRTVRDYLTGIPSAAQSVGSAPSGGPQDS